MITGNKEESKQWINSKLETEIKASLTVECSLVFPFFLYAIVGILYLFQIFFLHDMLLQAITKEGLELSKYGYVYRYIENYEETKEEGDKDSVLKDILITKSINAAFLRLKLCEYVKEDYIDHSVIKGGMSGISAYLSDFMGEEDKVDIILSYYVEPPVILLPSRGIFMLQRVTLRGWSGYRPAKPEEDTENSENSEESYVFITESGSVYHLWEDCTYLKLSIKQVTLENASILRNLSGGKYYPCELCGDNNNAGTVYITDTGDRYHTDIGCSGLKRTVLKILLSEAGDRSLCSRCRKRQGSSQQVY